MARAGKASTVIRLALGGLLALSFAGLAACSSSKDNAKLLNPDPPGKMYADADAFLTRGYFDDAARKFEDLDRDHPYAPEARRAMVMAAFSYYKAKKYPEAIAAARRYTTLHPGTKDAALAHHVIASSHYDEIKDPAHDQTAARRAVAEFKIILTRFPDSPYARQAENRLRIAQDSIAASEMYIGRYYLKKGNQVAAINRFKTVVTEHQTTQHVEEALFRLTEAYLTLGVVPEAQSATAVLGHNYPQSRWYADSYALLQRQGLQPQANSGSWITQQVRKIVPGQTPPPQPTNVPNETLPPAPAEPSATPPGRTPPQDIPTASTTRTRPLGFTNIN